MRPVWQPSGKVRPVWQPSPEGPGFLGDTSLAPSAAAKREQRPGWQPLVLPPFFWNSVGVEPPRLEPRWPAEQNPQRVAQGMESGLNPPQHVIFS